MNNTIRNGLISGLTFGIITIILVLIGFTNVVPGLIGRPLGFPSTVAGNIQALTIFLVLLGLWAGNRGARRDDPDTWSRAATGGLVAGLVSGVLIAIFALIIGTINARGIDPRQYLAQLSPVAINLFLFGRDSVGGALTLAGVFTASGLAGGLLAKGFFRSPYRAIFATWRKAQWARLLAHPVVERILAHPLTRPIFYGTLIVFILLLPLRLGQYWTFTLGTVGIYILMGLGINIVVGMAGLLNLGYVAFFAVGAYTVGLLTAPAPLGIMMDFWPALLLGIIFAALAGILLGIPVLRLRSDYLAIVTLGFGEISRILVRSDLLFKYTGGPQGVRNIAAPNLFGLPISNERAFMYMIILSILLAILITIRLQESRLGRSWMAMREDETVAQAMGINTYIAKLLAFSIGAALAGLGGAIFAARNQYTGPEDHNLLVSINVLAVLIVGGIGSIPGVIVGAFALKGLPEILRQLEDYRILAFGALLVATMVLRPEGLWPSQRRRLEIKEASLPPPDDQIAQVEQIEQELPPLPVGEDDET
jgi:ABC-type branched-subunit amino acid transport system permease subunit